MPVDSEKGKIYIISSKSGCVIRANLEGSKLENIGNLGGNRDEPIGIVINTVNGKMFVTNCLSGTYAGQISTAAEVSVSSISEALLISLLFFFYQKNKKAERA